jgi:DNA-binding NarL/FixJ family response regulator
MTDKNRIRVGLLSPQTFVAEGLKAVLSGRPELELVRWCHDLTEFEAALQRDGLDIGLIDCASRVALARLRELHLRAERCRLVLWGEQISTEFAVHAMECGVRGFLPGGTSVEDSIAALHSIWIGQPFCGEELMRSLLFARRIQLTRREGQLATLLAHGLKNKELATALGITEGTVKVYLSRLFKKLDVKDRFELALYALKNLSNGTAGLNTPEADPEAAGTNGLYSLSSVLLQQAGPHPALAGAETGRH